MILATQPTYPQSRSYVLKLHFEAAPEQGLVRGVIENLTTGRRFAFSSAEELIDSLVRDAIDTSRITNSPSAD